MRGSLLADIVVALIVCLSPVSALHFISLENYAAGLILAVLVVLALSLFPREHITMRATIAGSVVTLGLVQGLVFAGLGFSAALLAGATLTGGGFAIMALLAHKRLASQN